MHFSLRYSFSCIKSLNDFELPDFTVLIGKNGVGKTQLLSGIQGGVISVSGLPRQDIELYNFSSFHSGNPGTGSWEASKFHREVVELYFTSGEGRTLVEVAERIFQETLDRFELSNDLERRREFEETIRREIRSLPDFEILGTFGGDDAVTSYSRKLQQQVLMPLGADRQQKRNKQDRTPTSVNGNQATFISLAMKLSGKLPHELERSDCLRASNYQGGTISNQLKLSGMLPHELERSNFLRASNYQGGTISNQLSQIFTRYKVDQYHWARIQTEESDKSFRDLMREYRETEHPPWETLRVVLDRMRDTSADPDLFNFEFSDPEHDGLNYRNHQQYSFTTKFTNRSTGESYPPNSLSSGENILLSLCFAAYHKAMGMRQPGLVLLDEVDAVLHPSMISALIAGLKEQFVDNGTPVIMATHSVTTVSLVDEDAIFRVARSEGSVNVSKVSRSEAVVELSEGLATIDEGLKIAALESAAPITIMSEGKNTLHLKKWVDLFFPGKVDVFDKMTSATGKNQLASYARLLGRMETNSHVLFVWDCDARSDANEVCAELGESDNVTTFAFSRRDNELSSKGIENLYDEKYLEKFSSTTKREVTGESWRNMSGKDKTDFANHVKAEGTRDYFRHYGELEQVVQEILKKTASMPR